MMKSELHVTIPDYPPPELPKPYSATWEIWTEKGALTGHWCMNLFCEVPYSLFCPFVRCFHAGGPRSCVENFAEWLIGKES